MGPFEGTRREFRCHQHPTVRTCLMVEYWLSPRAVVVCLFIDKAV